MTLKLLLPAVALTCYSLFSGQPGFPYEQAWKKVDSLIQKKGLPKSALAEVNKIYAAAKKENQEAQWVKAVIYMMSLQGGSDEQSTTNFNLIEKEIRSAPPRVAAVLSSLEAGQLYFYLRQNRYRLQQAAEIQNDSSSDIATWTSVRLNAEIRSRYLQSLEPENLLKQTPVSQFDAVVNRGNARYLRPTLYDLLAYRALDYFQSDNPEQFTENTFSVDSAIFSSADHFTQWKLSDTDSSNQAIAFRLYQDLLKFHAEDTNPDAAIDADINRIVFAERIATFDNKDSFYLNALRKISAQYPDRSAAAKAAYLQAAFHAQQAAGYDPFGDTTHRFDYVKAKTICEQVVAQKDSSEGKTDAQILLNNILQKKFRMEAEQVNLPGQPFRVLVSYKQTARLYFRILSLKPNDVNWIDRSWDAQFWKKLTQLTPLKKFDQALPDTKDYQEHKTEIRVDALPLGYYALLASTDPDFRQQSAMAVQFLYCSSIAFVQRDRDYFVVNRETGEPLAGVAVQLLSQTYNSRQQEYVYHKKASYHSDAQGYFWITGNKVDYEYGNRLDFSLGNDHLSFTTNRIYSFSNLDEPKSLDRERYEREMTKNILFTDRSIYRPGQTLFFKGLVMTRDFLSRKYKILPGQRMKLYLKDANDQLIDSLSLQTDEFGSLHGNFKLPDRGLNGQFSISDSLTADERSFSVEEYKRPKFYVLYDTVKQTYRLGDSIHVSGSAQAYAGNAIDGAMVKYRVVRQARFPYPWFFRRMPSSRETVLAQGQSTTNASGQFQIGFIAKPDPKVDRKANPSFIYRIEADITDLNGETRSGSTTLSLSYRSFEIDCDLPSESRMPADSLPGILVTTENANGEFTSQRLSAALYRLKLPERLIRKRYWDQPDQFVMTEKEFLKSFPLDEYRSETDKTSWRRESQVEKFSDSTRESGQFFSSGKAMNLSPGWYELEFSVRDADGQMITDKRFVELTGSSNKPDYTGYNLIESENESAEPGDKVRIATGTAAKNVLVIRARQGLNDTVAQYSSYRLDREIGSTMIPVEEKDRGGFEVTDVFVKDNRWYTSSHLVRVPWTNKQLHIVYGTWRDKLLPGSRETWSVKITGQQKDPVAAELLTAMYDASLDQFSSHQWELPEIYPDYEADSWDGEINFSAKSSFDHNVETGTNDGFYNRYDQIWNSVYRELAGSAHGLVIRGLAAPNMMYAEEDKDMPMKKSMLEEAKFTPPKVVKGEAIADSVTVYEKSQPNPNEIQIRKNFNETAFFFPELKTDSSGNVEFSFTMPEALTRWKWMTFASTRDLSFGYSEKSVVTQKELMLQPNMPRFFREGDTLSIPVKIANLSKANQQGTVVLDWLSADESSKLNEKLGNRAGSQSFQVPAGQSTVVFFPLIIPAGFHEPVIYQVKASTPEASDGEQNMVPVLSNRLLVTESFPLNMREQTERSFSWEKLLNSGKSNTMQNQSLTVEYSTNPAWYAVQALPYLIEFPYECAEQTFNRLYADALATQIMNSAPTLRQVIESWNGKDSAALLSNLQKNEDLKIALLRETPWVLEAQNENEQKKNLAHLLDLTVMSRQIQSALDKLKQMQTDGGGFPWFTGGRDDRYITQYIATGIGRLRKLQAIPKPQELALNRILTSSVSFLDAQLVSDYKRRPKKEDEVISPIQIQYLYMRSFFPELPVAAKTNTAIAYYRKKILAQWVKQNMYLRGMAALYFYRTGAKSTAADVLRSLQENATRSEALGMYWKSVQPGYYWQESPVETQSLLIEAFQEMGQPAALIDDMKYWLLQQKRSTHWSSTKATADACYAVLMTGGNWLAAHQAVNIQLGEKINISGEPGEAGTGYFRKTVPGQQVQPAMGNIHIRVQPQSGNKPVPSSGALYWQYFENLDRITAGQSALSMEKALYLEKETKNGTVWEPVDAASRLKPGDKLKVRIIIKTDRDLEYVQLKDMRAACLEPVNVLSGYRWQGGLGYYESTSDESTSFFFDWLPKGTNVFEYPLLVTTAGTYSNGISSLQCMYAPEFAAHTGGIRLTVTGK